ncbi:X-ray radiation resistance-associated protein 1 [Eudromia elegans]
MATSGLYKTGDGSSYVTNCFPARSILGTSREADLKGSSEGDGAKLYPVVAGAGHWLLARGAPRRSRIQQRDPGETPKQRRKPQSLVAAEEDKILDEPFLMKHHCLKNPSDLCSVNISSQNLVSAKEDDFEKFDCVAFINAAENLLTLEAFRKFPGLRELELSLNGLRNLKVSAGDFLRLEDLDLSYNNLSPEDIWTLGELSQLKVLRLTANGLRWLPPDLAGSWDPARSRFASLEVLLLDDNRLSEPGVFMSLARLCSLRELNLDRNEISAVPYLRQAESTRFFLHPALDGGGFRAEWYKSLSGLGQQRCRDAEGPAEQPESVVSRGARDAEHTEVITNSGSQELPGPAALREEYPAPSMALPAPTTYRDLCAPFPELKHLSLAFNKIEEEAGLLPVAFFPCLKELTFHGNPLTITRSGRPPLLTRLLQENLGIKLVHQRVFVERLHFTIPLKASRKVSSHLPKVPKAPLMLEAPAGIFPWKPGSGATALSPSKPLPPIRLSAERREGPCEEEEEDGEGPQPAAPPEPLLRRGSASAAGEAPADARAERGGDEEWDSGPHPDGAPEAAGSFFLTQVEDEPRRPQRHVPEDGPRRTRSEAREAGGSPALPACYRGYEELLGGTTDPDFTEPVGLQRNVRALRDLLRRPRVLREAAAWLRSGHRPYAPRQRAPRMPGPPPRRTKADVLEGLLAAMRNTTTITEVPLVSVLRGRESSPEAYREALRLLRDFEEGAAGPVDGEEHRPGRHGAVDEVQAMRALLVQAASRQPPLLRKRVPKAKSAAGPVGE